MESIFFESTKKEDLLKKVRIMENCIFKLKRKGNRNKSTVRKINNFSSSLLQQVFYKYSLFIVGSTMCGFSTDNSDIDMCVIVKSCSDDARREELSYLQHIQFVLQPSGNYLINSTRNSFS